jgi:O-antigen/teichoic acid export membrane protein
LIPNDIKYAYGEMILFQFIRKLGRDSTIQNISYLTLGNAIAQVLSLVGAFYIPRILGAGDYGVLNIVTSYVAIFTVFAFTGFNEMITRACARDINNVEQIFNGFIGVRILFSIAAFLIAILCLFFVDYEITTKYYIVFFALSLIVGQPLLATINTVYQIHEKLRYTAIFEVIRSIITVSLSILAVTLGYGVLSLLIIRMCSWIAVIIVSTITIRKTYFPITFRSKILWDISYIRQGFVFTAVIFLNTLTSKIDLVMLSLLTTPVNVGIYALAHNVVNKGLIIRRAIQNSLFPVYVRKNNGAMLSKKQLYMHTLIILAVVAILIIAIVLSSRLIIFIVGEDYIPSIPILNVLAFYLALNFTIIPFELMMQTTFNEGKLILPRIVSSVLNIGLNLVFFHYFGLIGIAYSTLVTYAVSNVIVFVQAIKCYEKAYA